MLIISIPRSVNAMGDRIDAIETAIQDIVSNSPRPTNSTHHGRNASSTSRTVPNGNKSTDSGDDSLMLTSAPQGMSDDSSSTIGADRP